MMPKLCINFTEIGSFIALIIWYQKNAIQHEVNGLLIDVGDAEALAHALLRLVSDDQLIHEISVRAPEFIEGFSIQRAAQRYQHVYENLWTRAS